MHLKKATGLRAAALKYDILTALLALSMQDTGPNGRLAQRLALVITARLNWRTECFAVGVQELGKLGAVTDRTAKRELAQMRARGWITVSRAARRGRVTEHRVELETVLAATRGCWAAVGPDYVARMGQGADAPQQDKTVIPFPSGTAAAAPEQDGTLWAAAAQLLFEDDAAMHAAWLSGLQQAHAGQGRLELVAKTQFVASYVRNHLIGRVHAAVTMINPDIRTVTVSAG